jgi:hypothetical protein
MGCDDPSFGFYGFNMEMKFFFFTFNNLVSENGNHK